MAEQRVPLRSPRHGEFFRVHSHPAWRSEVILTRDEKGELYFIEEALVPDLMRLAPERLERCTMFLAQNSDGQTFLWPVTMPVPDDHPAYQAMEEWICLQGMQ